MAIKRDAFDALISTLVRERADWRCERCGTYYPPGPGRCGLHASHYKGRRHRWLRHDTDNVRSHCYGCHSYLGSSPAEFTDWMAATVGPEVMERLTRLMQRRDKQPHDWRTGAMRHYRAELVRVQGMREAGIVGLIRVVPYE